MTNYAENTIRPGTSKRMIAVRGGWAQKEQVELTEQSKLAMVRHSAGC